MTTPCSTGRISLVGIGPGSLDHMTPAARLAIVEADTVIGYATYIKLIEPLLDGKAVIRKAMTEEIERALEALDQARQGRRVALVCSGDAGVYGMAGPTYEVLFEAGWTPGSNIEVEVIPGASALNSCAARVGAPLTHDFCAISLSDLLTPWPEIERRLRAAADGDFVVALYNPVSQRRRTQLVAARDILLAVRPPQTPVVLARNLGRDGETVRITDLQALSPDDVDMLTLVLVGSSRTRAVTRGTHRFVYTPRGYAAKRAGQAAE